ncbi:DNA starvation/stationary phase protection protein Dps [Bdellovibrionota bacterium FG-2]
MLATRIDITESVRSKTVQMLNDRLADGIELMLQTKQAHWNLRGRGFFQLHKLFDEVTKGISEHVDTIAERIAQLGGHAEGTAWIVSERSQIEEYPRDIVECADHLNALSSAIAAFAKSCRECILVCEDYEDRVTEDIIVSATRSMDKYLWLVESNLPIKEPVRKHVLSEVKR